MKNRVIVATLTTAILFAPAVFAQNITPTPANPVTSEEKCTAECMTQMQANMAKMQGQMEKMHATTDPQARQKLMREHMLAMQENMKMMNSMAKGLKGSGMKGKGMKSSGMMDNDTNERLDMLEKRMNMTQMTMEQMMQRNMINETANDQKSPKK